jgi:hypothetical protein
VQSFDRSGRLREDAAMFRIAVLVVLALGCSKAKEQDKQSTPPPPPPPAADAAPVATPEPVAEVVDAGAEPADATAAVATSDVHFDDLSKEDKIKFMKQKVMPAMRPVFQKFDAKEFGTFTCKTCHGKDPQGSKYKMPSKDLPALDFDALKAGKEDPKMVEFMSKVVKPEMAKLLNEPEMTETNPKGFGCLACHQLKKK